MGCSSRSFSAGFYLSIRQSIFARSALTAVQPPPARPMQERTATHLHDRGQLRLRQRLINLRVLRALGAHPLDKRQGLGNIAVTHHVAALAFQHRVQAGAHRGNSGGIRMLPLGSTLRLARPLSRFSSRRFALFFAFDAPMRVPFGAAISRALSP